MHHHCHHLPPRSARTRWRTAPAEMLKSRADLSSGLDACVRARGGKSERSSKRGKGEQRLSIAVIDVHLSATEDEALLLRRNTRLLLDFLLDPSDLQQKAML